MKDDKKYIYHIINQYLSGEITIGQFCDEFYYCYDKELDYDTLTEKEDKLFGEISAISSRFSPFIEDLIKYPGPFFTEGDLSSKIKEVSELLKTNNT